jgi:hypothetical protein
LLERPRHKYIALPNDKHKEADFRSNASEVFHFTYNHSMTSNDFRIGDRVKIFLDSKYWNSEGWFDGTIIGIDPYSEHRNFYWVELDQVVEPMLGKATKLISILNPKNIKQQNGEEND